MMTDVLSRCTQCAQRSATHRIDAPAGALGLVLADWLAANKGVMIKAVAPDSPLAELVRAGWLLLEVDGATVAPGDHAGAARRLDATAASSRRLTLLDPQAERELCEVLQKAWWTNMQMELRLAVEAPPGRLGLQLANAPDGRPGSIVHALAPASPLTGRVGLRWASVV